MYLLRLATSECQARENVKDLSAQLLIERNKNAEADCYLQQRQLEFEELQEFSSARHARLRVKSQELFLLRQEVNDLRSKLKQFDQDHKIFQREELRASKAWYDHRNEKMISELDETRSKLIKMEQECMRYSNQAKMVELLETTVKEVQQECETLKESEGNLLNRVAELELTVASEQRVTHTESRSAGELNISLEQGQLIQPGSHSMNRRGGNGQGGRTAKRARLGQYANH